MSILKLTIMMAMFIQCQENKKCIELPQIETPPVQVMGMASYYNSPHGDNGLRGSGLMANGEYITEDAFIIATRDIPLDTHVLLEYKGRRVWAKSADRGPFGCIDKDGVWQIAVRPREDCEYRGVADLNYPVAKKLLGKDMKKGLNQISMRYYKPRG